MDGIPWIVIITMFHFDLRGDKTPFSSKFFKQNKIVLFVLLLIFNHLIASVVDIFDLEKYFSTPGDETNLKSKFLFFLIITGFVAPIIEEFLFRFWILKNVLIFTLFFIFLFLFLLLIDYNWIYNSLFLLTFSLQAIFIFKYPKKYILICLINGLVFSLFHITNYAVVELISGIYYLPVLLFPQFILGFFASYLKLKYGFRYAVVYHVLYNCSIIVFVYLKSSF